MPSTFLMAQLDLVDVSAEHYDGNPGHSGAEHPARHAGLSYRASTSRGAATVLGSPFFGGRALLGHHRLRGVVDDLAPAPEGAGHSMSVAALRCAPSTIAMPMKNVPSKNAIGAASAPYV